MAEGQLRPSKRRLRAMEEQKRPGSDTDIHLLQGFALTGDDAVFADMVRRHSALVQSVCRRLLPNPHDAEDALQATFLLLARKAHTIRAGRSLRSWLYCVAYRVALETRAGILRRRAQERQAGEKGLDASGPADARAGNSEGTGPVRLEQQERQQALLEEVERLPEKYRTPVVLCYLEGKTNEQAAQLLGCPRGTILSRLARARARLRKRLVDRGLAGVLEFVLPENS